MPVICALVEDALCKVFTVLVIRFVDDGTLARDLKMVLKCGRRLGFFGIAW